MFDDINNLIINEKKRLRKKSKDYIKNFEKIKNFIEKEVSEIENLKSSFPNFTILSFLTVSSISSISLFFY